MKESGDLIRRMLQSSHEGSCFMGDIVFAPRQAARMDREFQRVIEIFVRITLRGMGRQKEQKKRLDNSIHRRYIESHGIP